MQLPVGVHNIVAEFVAKYQLWSMPSGPEAEERARQWSTWLAEQLAFEFPHDGWGKKRADPGRPVSKDAIARQVGPQLLAWDMLTGAGTGAPALVPNPDSQDITGQVFVPVTPTNHLGSRVPPSPPIDGPVPSPIPTPPMLCRAQECRFQTAPTLTVDLSFVLELLQEHSAKLDVILAKQGRAYSGAVGRRVRLTPEE